MLHSSTDNHNKQSFANESLAQNNRNHSQYIINDNNHASIHSDLNNGTNFVVLNNNNHNNANANRKVTFNHHNKCVNNHNGAVYCNNNHNGVAKASVILNYDKNALEYKNNKNLILNSHNNVNKVETSTTNNQQHQVYEKHLNGINQLKNELQSTKRFIITTSGSANVIMLPNDANDVDCENNKNNGNKFPSIDDVDGEKVLHKVNRLLNHNGSGLYVKLPDLANNNNSNSAASNNGFVRNCTSGNNLVTNNSRSNDFSTIKINYVARQLQRTAATNQATSSHAQVTKSTINNCNKRFHSASLHEAKITASTNLIPNIVINGSNDLNYSDKINLVNGLVSIMNNEDDDGDDKDTKKDGK
jgi:hypothetical protein